MIVRDATSTYCTVLLRNPKRAVRRGFRPCFGFRRRAPSIPKKGLLAFFGFVVRTLLWITWRRPAMPRHALRQHLQAGRQRGAAEQWVFGDLLERVHAHDLYRLGGMGLLAFEPGRYRRAKQRRSIRRRSSGQNRRGDAASTRSDEVSRKTRGVYLQIDKA